MSERAVLFGINLTEQKTNLMKSIIIIFLFSFSIISNSQTIKKDTAFSKGQIGLYPGFYYANMQASDVEKEYANLFLFEFDPYLSYNLYQNIFIGSIFSMDFVWSDFYSRKSFIELGAFIKYILPFSIDKNGLRRIRPYIAFEYYKTNYRMVAEVVNTVEYKQASVEEDFIISEYLDQDKYSVPVGIIIDLNNNFFYMPILGMYNKLTAYI